MTDYEAVIPRLARSGVEFIIVGGMAAVLHGSARLTQDLDVVYRRTPDNIVRLAKCLRDVNPYLRGAPAGLPFHLDADTIRHGLNFTLTTDLGDLDLLGEIAGGGGYEDLLPHSIRVEIFGVSCCCLGLKRLIEVKRAAGRLRDLEAVAELETLVEEGNKPST